MVFLFPYFTTFLNVTRQVFILVNYFVIDQVTKASLEKKAELQVHPVVGMWKTSVLLIFRLFP